MKNFVAVAFAVAIMCAAPSVLEAQGCGGCDSGCATVSADCGNCCGTARPRLFQRRACCNQNSCCGNARPRLFQRRGCCNQNNCCNPAPQACCEPAPQPCCAPAPRRCCARRSGCCGRGGLFARRSSCGGGCNTGCCN